MQLDLEKNSGVFIRSFRPGELRVGNDVITEPVILTPEDIVRDWRPPDIAELGAADFAPALELNPEVVLFGTGPTQLFPPIPVVTEIMRTGIGFEVMDTAAACRTFNVLASESRRVVAALLI